MLTRFRDFVVKNKLYVGIGGVALALCGVVAVVFGVLAGQPSGLPVDNNSVLSSQEAGSDAVAASPEESGAADPSTSNLLALAKLFGVSAEELLKSVE